MKTSSPFPDATAARRARPVLALALPLALAALAMAPAPAAAQVASAQKISAFEGGFTGALDPFDLFGWSLASLGDLDGDGVGDLAVGSFLDDDGGASQGAVWILFLNPDGTVKSHAKISATSGGFTGHLDPGDFFGTSLAPLGDLDGDGVIDLAVGAYYDDDGGPDQGAVWILFLDADGTVKSHAKISATAGGFTGTLHSLDWFGWAMTSLGDLDGDGVVDLAVAADGDDGPGMPGDDLGAVYVLFLHADGTVKAHTKIGVGSGGFTAPLIPSAYFGSSLAPLGDVDGDGVVDLAVGSDGDDDPSPDAGAMWVLLLEPTGTAKGQLRIGSGAGGLMGPLMGGDQFGRSMAALGDLDGDGISELAVGADRDDTGGTDKGSVRVLSLDPTGMVKFESKIAEGVGGFPGPLLDGDHFGNALAAIGDHDGNGMPDLVAGAEGSDDGGPEQGAAWVLFLAPPGPPPPTVYCPGTGCPCGNDSASGGCANSSGSGASISAAGSTSVAADDLVLTVTDVPAGKFGVIYMGGAPHSAPFGDGLRCVKAGAAGIVRFPLQNSGAAGELVRGPGLVALRPASLVPGSTWYFQAWFRDSGGPCGGGINLSDAIEVTFAP